MIYLNLTNGIEYLKDWDKYNTNYANNPFAVNPLNEVKFIRIQSTQCEQKNWDLVLQDLDYDFLLRLAMGYHIKVVDYSQKKEASRAMYQGLTFIRYCLERRWYGRKIIPIVNNYDCSKYFDEVYRKLDKRTFKKLDYFKKFLMGLNVNLTSSCYTTQHDGDYDFYKDVLENSMQSFYGKDK